jgi:D-beta-D-heptose 7-phosphate kinase / D-beta-D-heptose 1-phosphate adenosyltransferase
MTVHTTPELLCALESARGKRVLVVGDAWLDLYLGGEVIGLSPEAPVPLIRAADRRHGPGGAGNVAAGLAALGAEVHVLSAVGSDEEGDMLLRCLETGGVDVDDVISATGCQTAVHSRITARDAHAPERTVLQINTPGPEEKQEDLGEALVAAIPRLASRVDAIVVIESLGGLVGAEVVRAAQEAARANGCLLVGDASGTPVSLRGYDVVLPNERQAAALLGVNPITDAAVTRMGERLVAELGNGAAAITRGHRGISVFSAAGSHELPAHERRIFDVTGAGDTVTAAFTAAWLGGAELERAAEIANLAAFVAVGRPGMAVVSTEDIRHAIAEVTSLNTGGKLRSRQELAQIVRRAKSLGKKVVFTNGCFDILHPGHVTYLRQAAELGDALIVALNSDASVQALKGPSRPILKQDERVMILSALEAVTWVTVFDEQRVDGLLGDLQPDIWVKGGDYTLETLNRAERDVCLGYGGHIELIPPVEGVSTTGIVERIENARRQESGG